MENDKSGAIRQSIIKLANQFICAIKKVVKIQFSQLKQEEPIYQSRKNPLDHQTKRFYL